MRAIRYFLQAALLLFGGSAMVLYVRSAHFNTLSFLALGGFFVLLFCITFLLREPAEARLSQRHRLSPTALGIGSLVLGAGAVALGVCILNGYTGSTLRRGVLLHAAIQVVGPWPPALFFLAAGLHFLRIGCRAVTKP